MTTPRDAAKEQVERLREVIRHHDHLYYSLESPEISDGEYDGFLRELRRLEELHPSLITQDSPTQRVSGEPSERFQTVRHPVPLLSLGNVFGDVELEAWERRVMNLIPGEAIDYYCEPKFDGLAVALTYENGMLVRGATRGTGVEGEDVTANLRTVRSIPLRVSHATVPTRFEVRGEILFPIDKFEEMNREREARGEPAYANPRNTAAGSVRQLAPQVTASRPLDLYIYSLGWADGDVPETQSETLEWLQAMGFKISPLNHRASTLSQAAQFYQDSLRERESLNYATDGVVIKVNSFRLQQLLGVVGREPRWAIAYKYPAAKATTRLENIDINVGRTGVLTPFAILTPITVGGVTVSRATLHNENYIREHDIRIGDMVTIQRAGDVIPQILGPVKDARTGAEREWTMRESCPRCEYPVVRQEGEVVHRCTNTACPAQSAELIKHFVSRPAMNIRDLGEERIDRLCDLGLIRDFADLYTLTKKQVAELESEPKAIGEKAGQKILEKIHESLEKPLANVIYALKISGVGQKKARILAERYGDMDHLAAASREELARIPKINASIAESIFNWFSDAEHLRLVAKLREAGVRTRAENALHDGDGGREMRLGIADEDSTKHCTTQAVESIRHFVSTDAMTIEGVGGVTIDSWYESGLIQNAADLYTLTATQLAAFQLKPGPVGESVAKKILENLEESRERPLAKIIFALGIRHVGEETAQLLAERYGDMDDLAAASREEMADIYTIGTVVTESIFNWFRDDENLRLVAKLREAGVRMREERTRPAGDLPWIGEEIVVTGRLTELSRTQAEEMIRNLGGKTGRSVTRKTTLVVAGADAGSKLERAQRLETPIIDEDEFLRRLKEAETRAEVVSLPPAI